MSKKTHKNKRERMWFNVLSLNQTGASHLSAPYFMSFDHAIFFVVFLLNNDEILVNRAAMINVGSYWTGLICVWGCVWYLVEKKMILKILNIDYQFLFALLLSSLIYCTRYGYISFAKQTLPVCYQLIVQFLLISKSA